MSRELNLLATFRRSRIVSVHGEQWNSPSWTYHRLSTESPYKYSCRVSIYSGNFEWIAVHLRYGTKLKKKIHFAKQEESIPNIASVNNATKPIDSMNQGNGSIKYVTIAPSSQKASIKSRYDWKSVQFQKYFRSKSTNSRNEKKFFNPNHSSNYSSLWNERQCVSVSAHPAIMCIQMWLVVWCVACAFMCRSDEK